jgi:hypothetical protein
VSAMRNSMSYPGDAGYREMPSRSNGLFYESVQDGWHIPRCAPRPPAGGRETPPTFRVRSAHSRYGISQDHTRGLQAVSANTAWLFDIQSASCRRQWLRNVRDGELGAKSWSYPPSNPALSPPRPRRAPLGKPPISTPSRVAAAVFFTVLRPRDCASSKKPGPGCMSPDL